MHKFNVGDILVGAIDPSFACMVLEVDTHVYKLSPIAGRFLSKLPFYEEHKIIHNMFILGA